MRRDPLRLADILKACDKIATYLEGGEDEFRANEMIQDAVVRNLEIIGEASKNLSPELKAAAGELPWRNITGMRDKLVHQYFGIDLELVWDTATSLLPPLRARIAAISDANNESSQLDAES